MMKNVNFIIKHNSLSKGFMKKLLTVSLFAFFIAFTACNNANNNLNGLIEADTVPVTSVSIKKTVTVTSGDTYTFDVKVLPENATDKTVVFKVDSKYKDYATVLDKNAGKIKFENTGNKEAVIEIKCTAQDGSKKTAKSTVTINLALPPVFNYSGFDFISAGPAYDCSSNMVISWHSEVADNVIEYTDANGEAFTNTKTVMGTKTECDWADKASFYRCRIELTGLEPDAVYKYRVKKAGAGEGDTASVSDIRTFTTAGNDTSFNFAVLSDLHTPKGSKSYIKNISQLLDYSLESIKNDKSITNKTLPLCIFNGDMVNKGQTYQQWNYWGQEPSLAKMIYAFVEGNHDYYPYKNKDRVTDFWYLDCVAIPNAQDSTFNKAITTNLEPTNYYFIYNNVLFICLDTMMMEASDMSGKYDTSFAKQQQWFKEVVNANLGKYSYLVVTKHYTFINGNTVSDYGDYNSWYKLFDECMVDFAIGSDEHTYSRTKPLYQKKTQENSTEVQTVGTVYLTTPQTEGSLSNITDRKTGGLSAFDGTEGGCGGLYFNVSDKKMTMHLIGREGKECDTCTVFKRDRSGFTGFEK